MKKDKITRKKREHIYHRTEILQTALKLFSESGFHNVTMNEIAKGSEFAVGTLYKFFKNKEDLYRALIVEKAEEFHSASMDAIKIRGDETVKIRACIEAKIQAFVDNLDFIRLYFAETRGASFNIKAGLDAELKKSYSEYLNKLSAVFKTGIRKKKFREFDPYLLAVAIDGMTNALLMEYLDHQKKHTFDAEFIMDIFFSRIHLESTQ